MRKRWPSGAFRVMILGDNMRSYPAPHAPHPRDLTCARSLHALANVRCGALAGVCALVGVWGGGGCRFFILVNFFRFFYFVQLHVNQKNIQWKANPRKRPSRRRLSATCFLQTIVLMCPNHPRCASNTTFQIINKKNAKYPRKSRHRSVRNSSERFLLSFHRALYGNGLRA